MADQVRPTDDQILTRAQEIKADRGLSLTDAMIAAEDDLMPEPIIPTHFAVTVQVKARVASWILSEFGGHEKLTVEERLAAYLAIVLSRSRVQAMRYADGGQDAREGKAVTMTRDEFARRVPTQ